MESGLARLPGRRTVTRRLEQGVSLLEAIVSLAVLSAVGLALFAMLNQSLQMMGRAERAREADAALRNAVAWMEQVNPMEMPTGREAWGEVVVSWRADPVEPPLERATGQHAAGLYRIGLYDVELRVERSGQLVAETRMRRVGWQQVAAPDVL